jgi:hypothetical protein
MDQLPHAAYETFIHLIAPVLLGIATAIWAAVKWAGSKFACKVENLEARVQIIERDYMSRDTVASMLDRMDQRVSDGFARIDKRLDDLYSLLHK